MKRAYRVYLLLLLAQVVLAIICGPHSCEWGNAVYFWAGVAALLLSLLAPQLQKEWPWGKRIGFGLLFLLGSVVVWCSGFMLGEFRIMCRMF